MIVYVFQMHSAANLCESKLLKNVLKTDKQMLRPLTFDQERRSICMNQTHLLPLYGNDPLP